MSLQVGARSWGANSLTFERYFVPTVVNPRFDESIAGVPYASKLSLTADESRRVLYTIDEESPGFVATYDLDSLEPLGDTFDISGFAHAAAVLPDSGWLVMASGTGGAAGGTQQLEVFEAANHHVRRLGEIGLPAGLGSPLHQAIGLATVTDTHLVFLLARDVTDSSSLTLSLVDLDGVEQGNASLRWTERIPSCLTPVDEGAAAIGYVPTQRAVYFGCAETSVPLSDTFVQTGAPAGVGRVRLTLTDGVPDQPDGFVMFPRSGDFRTGISAFDPTTERLMLSGGASGTGFFVAAFDTHHEVWVGTLSLGGVQLYSMAIGQSAGRFYGQNADGITAIDTATTPLEQGRSFPGYFASLPDDPSKGGTNVIGVGLVDDIGRRLFIGPYDSEELGARTPYWFVMHDARAAYVAPDPDDPDIATADIPEVPGETGRTFNVSAQGFGTRTTQVGGTGAVTFNMGAGDVVWGTSGGTRKTTTAFVDRLTLSGSEATSRAISADRDQTTTGSDESNADSTAETACTEAGISGDSEQGSPACPGVAWPVASASCEDFGGATAPPHDETDGSEVSCNLDELAATAASTGASTSTDDVGTSGSRIDASVRVDDELGSVSTVTATADGISFLAGAATFGRVEATLSVSAHGRPETATGAFTRSVRDVSIAGQVVCTDNCDLESLADTFNEQFVGRARLEFPEPDPGLLAGSPGGAQAVGKRLLEEQVQAVLLNEQSSDRVEVPGMILYVYGNNAKKPSNTIYEFAGVEAEARYSIFSLGGTDDGTMPTTEQPSEPTTQPSEPSGGSGGGTGTVPGGGGSGELAPDRQVVAAPSGPGPGLMQWLETYRKLVLNEPVEAVMLLLVWLVLLWPVYLAARRWVLLCRGSIVQEARP